MSTEHSSTAEGRRDMVIDDVPLQVVSDKSNTPSSGRQDPPPIAEQRRVIKEGTEQNLKKGDTWYLVEFKWFQALKKYLNLENDDNDDGEKDMPGGQYPGIIDNSPLVAGDSSDYSAVSLHTYVQEKKHYEMVPEETWKKLISWYGGGPSIPRQVIEQGEASKRTLLDLHPYFVSVAHYTNENTNPEQPLCFNTLSVSKTTSLNDVSEIAARHFNVDTEKFDTRLWAGYRGSPYKIYKPVDMSKEVEQIITRPVGQQIIMETKEKDRTSDNWPLSYQHSDKMNGGNSSRTGIGGMSSGFLRSSADTSSSDDSVIVSRTSRSLNSHYSNSGDGKGGLPGVCGLHNLGNTCFMNSALQCLTKSDVLHNYFVVEKRYADEINTTNKLGMGGKVAMAFGELMEEMWGGKHSRVSPREFKAIIGKFAPQFSGYQQQDSQEFIAYLLDGLHEDLNRIYDKPPTLPVESNGRDDEIVSKEAWQVHKKRNDSIIVDNFQGQLKSTLVCPEPECSSENYVSITFDPFMYLGLPLPSVKSRIIDVTVYRYGNSSPPVKYGVKVPKQGSSSELRVALAQMINEHIEKDGIDQKAIKTEEIVLADIFNNKIYRFLPDSAQITTITESDVICAYEVPGLSKDSHKEYDSYTSSSSQPFIGIRLCTLEKQESYLYGTQYRTASVGIPFVLPFDKSKTTKKELYDQCYQFVRRYLKTDITTDIDWDQPSMFFPRPKVKKTPKVSEEDESNNMQDDENPPEQNKVLDVKKNDQEDEEPKFILFELKFDTSYMSSYDDNTEQPIAYSEELASKSKEDEEEEEDREQYYYNRRSSSEKKNASMFIHPKILSKLVDKDKLNQTILHPSVKAEVKQQEKGVSLDDCLNLFSSVEKLGPDDPWYCPKCKKFVQATKKFDIWNVPDVLVVHLKRFHYSRFSRDKMETFIDYPVEGLDMSPHVPTASKKQEQLLYDLFAVSNHYGGLGGGHYTAFAKNSITKKWYKFDDEMTAEVDSSKVVSNAAYVLFYRRRTSPTTKSEK